MSLSSSTPAILDIIAGVAAEEKGVCGCLRGLRHRCACRRYRKGLPPTVMKMNEECLRLRPHDHPGYQTVAEIKRIVGEAIGPQQDHHQHRVEALVDNLVIDDESYF